MLTLLLLPSLALAQESASFDIELLRPTWSANAPPGFDSPTVRRAGAYRTGVLLQFQHQPLVLYDFDTPTGAVIGDRVVAQVGGAYDLSKRASVRANIPLMYQWGGEVSAFPVDGVVSGDLTLGGRLELYSNKKFGATLRLDVGVPTSSAESFAGDSTARAMPGLVLGASLGKVRVLGDAGLILRKAVETDYTLALGNELTANAAVSYEVKEDKASVYVGALNRFGITSPEVGETGKSSELVAGTRLALSENLALDLGVGHGLNQGYGTTTARGLAAIAYHYTPKPPAPTPKPVVTNPITDPTPDIPPILEEHESKTPEPPPLAKVEQKEIKIRDPIQFEKGTDKILPESMPTLNAVARLMNENPDIQLLVIEGHASDEGEFAYNYQLSVVRALAIYRALVEEGVHPSRLACRGFGEVAPVAAGDAAANRRVVFHIASRLAPTEPNPGWSSNIVLPWNGEAKTIPAAPATTPAPAPEKKNGTFDPDEDSP